MKRPKSSYLKEVVLPWSDGLMSARLWRCGERTIAAVPELGLHCYGDSQTEAVFRLFTTLLKYYRQLKAFKSRLNSRGLEHFELLSGWVESIEGKIKAQPEKTKVLVLSGSKRH
jgi:glutathionyl-hydroquinone reductase